MRLSSFQIRNFKSIEDTGLCELSKDDNILVLAGQNEAGKSAIVEALDFFGNGPSEHFDRLHRRQDKHPEVACNFLLEDSDIEEIFQDTQNEQLKQYLMNNPLVGFTRGNVTKDDFEEVYLTEDSSIALSAFYPENSEPQEPPKEPDGDEEGEEDSDSKPEENAETISDIDGLTDHIFQKTRDFIFFDTFDALLPGEVKISEIPNYPAVDDFQKVFKINFTEIIEKDTRAIGRAEQRLNREASDNLNTYWTQKLEENSKYNFGVKISIQEADKQTSNIEFKIDKDDGDPLFLEQKSKGFRWFSAFNLRLRALGVEEETIKNLVILIDEPGQGLHEKAQENVKKVLEELSVAGAQIIYTTHHPHLIGTEGSEFARIRLISNTKKLGTKVDTVAQFASRPDQGARDALSPIVTAMGIHGVESLLDARRLNIVVEGISDHYYFEAFKKLLKKDERLYFLPACGVSNVPSLVSVLIGWGCNYKAVFDDDAQSGRKAYNLLKKGFYENDDSSAHNHILKIKRCNGIEDIFAPKDFYQFVLEQEYPKPKPKDDNSKLAEGRKEVLARLFLERVNKNEVNLSKESVKSINETFDWLYEKFNINAQ